MEPWKPTLEAAVRRRDAFRLSRDGRRWIAGSFVRMDESGLVCRLPKHDLRGGEAVRLLCEAAEEMLALRATVLRCGVPIPDRGAQGIALGFLSAQAPVQLERPAGVDARLVLSGGVCISLIHSELRLLDLGPDGLQLEAPRQHGLVFARDAELEIRLVQGEEHTSARLRIESISQTRSSQVYSASWIDVADQEAHARWLRRVGEIATDREG